MKLLLLHIPRQKKENGKYSRELRLTEPAIHLLHSLIKLTQFFFMKTTQCIVIFFAKSALSTANNASAQAGSLHMPKVFFSG